MKITVACCGGIIQLQAENPTDIKDMVEVVDSVKKDERQIFYHAPTAITKAHDQLDKEMPSLPAKEWSWETWDNAQILTIKIWV